MPRFSVIMPLYNKESFVVRALESVAGQSYRDFEMIVVDDGSSDLSAQCVEQYFSSHPSLPAHRLLRQPNSGVSATRNHGVEVSCGQYVAFLDCDDWWAPSFLEEMNALVLRHPDAGIYGSGYYIVKNGQPRVAPVGVDATFTEGLIDYLAVYSRTLCMPLTSDTVVLRRELFDAEGGFRTGITLGEDFDLWVRLALKHPVAFLNRPLAYYYQDLNARQRAIGRLHDPATHYLWHLGILADTEQQNPALKLLLDNMRTYNLLPYYLSSTYHLAARQELDKVDWSRQPARMRRLYRMPLWLARLRMALLKAGSRAKQTLLRLARASQ